MTLLTKCGLVFTLGLAVVLSGCESKTDSTDPDSSPAASTSTLKGEIKINGSSTVQPISNAIRELFIKEHPGVAVDVRGDGTGNGFKDFYGQSTDISDASRPIKAGELEKCNEAGVKFIEIPVAYDGLTIVVHPENDFVKELTVDQLKKIFTGEEGTTWKDVDSSWPDKKINIFAPGTGSGTYDYFHEVVAKPDGLELHGDMTLSEDDNALVIGVSGDKDAIGFFGVAYYEENKDDLRAVPIVNPADDTAYLPTKENIATNKYAPFSRPLFIYANVVSTEKAEVQAFIEFFLANVSKVCEDVGYVRLPDDILATAQANYDSGKTGTHFVDDKGEGRSGLFVDNFKPENLISQ